MQKPFDFVQPSSKNSISSDYGKMFLSCVAGIWMFEPTCYDVQRSWCVGTGEQLVSENIFLMSPKTAVKMLKLQQIKTAYVGNIYIRENVSIYIQRLTTGTWTGGFAHT